jgi:hypothetical protein
MGKCERRNNASLEGRNMVKAIEELVHRKWLNCRTAEHKKYMELSRKVEESVKESVGGVCKNTSAKIQKCS